MVVEDGTGINNADSYVCLAFADDYFLSRGFSKWQELAEEQKEIALVNATDFVDNTFQWKGVKISSEQALNFPRQNLFDANGFAVSGVPTPVKQAVCEAIRINIDGQLYDSEEVNGAVVSEKIGNLQFTYDVSQKKKVETRYDSINKRLRGLFVEKSHSQIFSIEVARK